MLKAQVNSMSADGNDERISTIAELSDNSATSIDFQAMAERIGSAAKRNMAPVAEQDGILAQLWRGLVEDLKGSPSRPAV